MSRDHQKTRRIVQHEFFLNPSIYPPFHIKKEVSDATLASFCDEYQEFLSLPRLMSKLTEMDHVQNVEKLCQRLDVLSDRYLEKISYNAHQKNDPKTLMLI